ncbi:GspH/FimT family pseudopilin [Pontibacter sp. JAM-7]|uniref:GspH/FimT family pseudopilin n=1 Tax=Pontibacter sp. JAM-7 TaxID=3366581 RepID=UPI003AF5A6B3
MAGADGITKPSAQGFTLLELLVVLVIASLGMTLMVPQFSNLIPGAELRGETRKIAAMLRHARSVAIAQGQAVSFSQDPETGEYALSFQAAAYQPPERIQLTVAANMPGAATGQILFYPDGSSSGGAVKLQSGTRQGEVMIDWLTGRVTSDD